MTREVVPGFHWIQECGPDRSGFIEQSDDDPPTWYRADEDVHIPQNVYLLQDEESLLFDTMSPASTEMILSELDSLLDGGELDYLVVSHPDVPHAGNTHRILEEYPSATLVAPAYGSGHELYHLDDAVKVAEGDSIDLGSFTVRFHEATFLDAALHLWMSEERTNTLFPVDWLGFPHTGAECLSFVDEFQEDLGENRLTEFHGRVLFWLRYVDVEKTNREIDRLIEEFAPEIIAPAHGAVIRENAVEYMDRMKDSVAEIDRRGRVGTLG